MHGCGSDDAPPPDLDYFLVLPGMSVLPAEQRALVGNQIMFRVLRKLDALFKEKKMLQGIQRSQNAITFYLRHEKATPWEGVDSIGMDLPKGFVCALQVIGWYDSMYDVINTPTVETRIPTVSQH